MADRLKIPVALLCCLMFGVFGCSTTPAPVASFPDAEPAYRADLTERATARDASSNPPLHPERRMVDITTNAMSTPIGFMGNRPPPPWPRGNYLSFHFRHESSPGQVEMEESWQVINIHTENLRAITDQLGSKIVEMLIFPVTNFPSRAFDIQRSDSATNNNGSKVVERPVMFKQAYAIVADPRIPRDWFHFEPTGTGRLDRPLLRRIKAAYPAYFRPNP